MKIFLTGATGFIGGHFLRHLSKAHEVIVLARDDRGISAVRGMGASQVILGDVTAPDFISALPDGIDLLCHCAGILGRWGVPLSVYRNVHVKGTDNVLDACRVKKIKRLLHISSAGVLGAERSGAGDEKSGYNPKTDYEKAKTEAEKKVFIFREEQKADVTVLRPEFVYGEGNLHILGLFKMIKAGKFFLIEGGRGVLHPTYIGDLIQALDLVMNASTRADIYMVAGDRAVTVKEFSKMIAGFLNIPAPEGSLPLWMAKGLAVLSEGMGKAFHFNPVLTRSRVDFFTANRVYSTKKISTELGYRPVKLEEGLSRTVSWYIKNGYIPQ